MKMSLKKMYIFLGRLPVVSFCIAYLKLEDLKVLKRSLDIHNNVKIGQGQLRHII